MGSVGRGATPGLALACVPKSKGDADTFIFANGRFRSTACDAYGFAAAPYHSTRQGKRVSFEATAESAEEGTMAWKGTVTGSTLSGTVLWTKGGKKSVEYWFQGTSR